MYFLSWRHGGNCLLIFTKGFWKSMDTSKDQQELERLIERNQAPWLAIPLVSPVTAAAGTELTESVWRQ